jgi:hypothetical protein
MRCIHLPTTKFTESTKNTGKHFNGEQPELAFSLVSRASIRHNGPQRTTPGDSVRKQGDGSSLAGQVSWERSDMDGHKGANAEG